MPYRRQRDLLGLLALPGHKMSCIWEVHGITEAWNSIGGKGNLKFFSFHPLT